jgi:hypothetical protein
MFQSPIGKELVLSLEEPGLDSKKEPESDIKSNLVVVGARVNSDTIRPENPLARSLADPIGRVSS